MQVDTPVQLTPVPPKPTCTWIFKTGPCADLHRAYNQAMAQRVQEELQLNINRQKELATAPLQQQIADLNTLVSGQQAQLKKLQAQMQVDANSAAQQAQEASTAALQAQAAARTRGMEQGIAIGIGAALLLVGVILSIKKLMSSFTVTKKAKAASA